MSSEVIISLKNAVIQQKDHLVLSEVDFEIRKGEFVYLVGKTGSGKSSLLRTLYGDLKLGSGQGHVAGFDLTKLKRRKIPHLRRKIGIVFQDFQLLSDRSVEDNLKFVMRATGWKDKKKMKQRIQEVLESVGLGNKGFRMPHRLSGGEQQRVAIARALVNDPELILADEPTGNLDPETSQETLELLFDISKNGRAILMASHDIALMNKHKARTLVCRDERVFDEPVSGLPPVEPDPNPGNAAQNPTETAAPAQNPQQGQTPDVNDTASPDTSQVGNNE